MNKKCTEPELGSYRNPSHAPWRLRRHAVVQLGTFLVRPNIHPVASELHDWLDQEGFIRFFPKETKQMPGSFDNPHTYDSAMLGRILVAVFNETHEVATRDVKADEHEIEIRRIRLTGELLLYAARFCEAVLKQLLYCTDFPFKSYRDASIGNLLSTECRRCTANGQEKHMISLVASVGCKYGLCREIDGCLIPYLRQLNRDRAQFASHSSIELISGQSSDEARSALIDMVYRIGTELKHALKHIMAIEKAVFSDIETAMQLEQSKIRTLTIIPGGNDCG